MNAHNIDELTYEISGERMQQLRDAEAERNLYRRRFVELQSEHLRLKRAHENMQDTLLSLAVN